MTCLLPQFKCQIDTFAVNFRAPPTKISGPNNFQARCVLSTISAPTSTVTVLDAEKLQIASLEACSISFSAKSLWTQRETIDLPTKASFEATLVKETCVTSDKAVITAAVAASEAIALAKAAVKVAKDAKALIVNNNQYDAESRPTILSEVNSIQSSWVQLTETEESGAGASVERSREKSSDLEPMDEELKFLEEQISSTVAVRSIRQTERKARRANAAAKASAIVMPVNPRFTRRKKHGPTKGINYADPLRHARTASGGSKLLTAAEERELSAGIQDLLKLEKLQQELTERGGGEPTLTQWANAAGIDHRTLQSRLNYGISCKEKMIKCNVRLVVSIAKKYQGVGLDLQDLIQDGCRGLIRATEKFDASRGFKFSTYAHSWIRQGVQKGVKQKSKFNRLPSHIMEASYKVKRAREQFVNEHKRHPNYEELAAVSGFTMKKLMKVLSAPKIVISLDQKTNENSVKPSEYTSDPNQESTTQMAMKEFLEKDVNKILDSLSPRESQVVRWRFGMVGGRKRALVEIGQMMSLSRERIRQIEVCALRKLKNDKRVEDLKQYQYQYAEDS
uniref:RNA polymerase sigma factor n=1 Tax=Geranium maderense TaxID=28964 RepID=A0A0G2SY57_9ROSI|nr:sigma factor [Geranium maderense]